MSKLLSGKTAVITGAASGNGREIARKFAEHGANVVIGDLRRKPREGGTPTDKLIETETASNALYQECDVSDPSDLEDLVASAEEYGGVDVMVNNAGILRETSFLDVDEDEFDTVIDVNLKGVFFGAQAASRRMLDSDGGCIVNISSAAGMRGAPRSSSYCASKGGVRLLTYSLAAELAPEVRVNSVHPGYIETAMTTEDIALQGTDAEDALRSRIPMERLGTPDDVANATLYLASDLSDFVTGESLLVDGGDTNTV